MISTKKIGFISLCSLQLKKHRVSVSSSSNISFKGITHNIWTCFKQIVDRIITEKKLTLNEICINISSDINYYRMEKICTQTIKNFYNRDKNRFFSETLDKISV